MQPLKTDVTRGRSGRKLDLSELPSNLDDDTLNYMQSTTFDSSLRFDRIQILGLKHCLHMVPEFTSKSKIIHKFIIMPVETLKMETIEFGTNF